MFYIEHTAVLNQHSMQPKSTVPTLPLQKLRDTTALGFGRANAQSLCLEKRTVEISLDKKILPVICLIGLYLKYLDTPLLTCSRYLEVGGWRCVSEVPGADFSREEKFRQHQI